MIGEYKGSGFKETPYLARRMDGQVLQLPRLLYLVATNVDGRRSYADIADAVSEAFGRDVSEDNVRFLADTKLRPLGVLALKDGTSPKLERPNPLLALNFKTAVVPSGLVNAVTTVFRPFFWPLVAVLGVAGFGALDAWLFFLHGVAQGIRHLLDQPVFFLVVFGLIVASAALHECGHATACRYGGARPGVMGVGIYLVWPAFYTDVTDAYRLSKGGRLRTDLGGVYFNALFMLAAVGVYLLTHFEILIAVILLLQFEMLHQFLPFLRLDGYYMISDLTGVPDIFARMKPVLLSLLPRRKPDPRVTALKGWVRVAVTVWVFLTVAFILYAYGMMLLHLPSVVGTAWVSFRSLLAHSMAAFAQGQFGLGGFGALQILLLALPVLGLAWMIIRLLRSLIVRVWVRTRGRPLRRVTSYAAMAAAVALLVRAWISPPANYSPIPPNARGTVQESFTDSAVVLGTIAAPVAKAINVKLPLPTATPSPASSTAASPGASPAASPSASSNSAGTTTITGSPSPTPSPSPT